MNAQGRCAVALIFLGLSRCALAADVGPESMIARRGEREPSPAAEQTRVETALDSTLTVSPRSLLWRSAVVPGWGQVRNGRYVKAVGFAAAAGSFLAASVVEIRALDRAVGSDREEIASRRNTRILLFVTTATFAALDAYVDAHLNDLVVELEPVSAGDGVGVGVRRLLP